MSIIQNKSTAYGNVLLIRATSPIIGLLFLSDFIDDVEGENVQNFFTKEFRYAEDGINFTAWIPLTIENIANVQATPQQTFVIEYRYTHDGSGGVGELAFNSVEVRGQFTSLKDNPIYRQSIFQDFFNADDTEVLGWCLNVTEKLYRQGIVAKYILRGDEDNINGIDRDYLDFWRTVACFFAYIVKLARTLSSFRSNPLLFSEFLKERGLYLCGQGSFESNNYLIENYFDEIRLRGTRSIYRQSPSNEAGGELLRLLCFDPHLDEFIFHLTETVHLGTWIDRSSEDYRGSQFQASLIKGYEPTEGLTDLTVYPLINGLDIILSDKKAVISSSTPTGFGGDEGRITVNLGLCYEVFAYIKTSTLAKQISLGAKAFDALGNEVLLEFADNSGSSGWFFQQESLAVVEQAYILRGIIYPANTVVADARLDVGFGKHLRFTSQVKKIVPQLIVEGSGIVEVLDFKFKICSLPYSTGALIQSVNLINLLAVKRTQEYSQQQIEEIIRKYLIPYNSTLQPIWLT